MKYIYLTDPAEHNLEPRDVRFIPPTYRIHELSNALENILPTDVSLGDEFQNKRINLIKNLSHRLNYLELINAMLCCHYAVNNIQENRSALCGGLLEMKQMNFCMLTYSIFEGIGSYFFRLQVGDRTSSKVSHENWSKALSEFLAKKDFTDNALVRKRKKKYQQVFNYLRDLRDRIHLDKTLEEHDYSLFYGRTHYKHAIRCLRILFKRYLELPNVNFVTIKLDNI